MFLGHSKAILMFATIFNIFLLKSYVFRFLTWVLPCFKGYFCICRNFNNFLIKSYDLGFLHGFSYVSNSNFMSATVIMEMFGLPSLTNMLNGFWPISKVNKNCMPPDLISVKKVALLCFKLINNSSIKFYDVGISIENSLF